MSGDRYATSNVIRRDCVKQGGAKKAKATRVFIDLYLSSAGEARARRVRSRLLGCPSKRIITSYLYPAPGRVEPKKAKAKAQPS
jgi:hypothetical protein